MILSWGQAALRMASSMLTLARQKNSKLMSLSATVPLCAFALDVVVSDPSSFLVSTMGSSSPQLLAALAALKPSGE